MMNELAVFWMNAHDKMATLAIRNAREVDDLRKEVSELKRKVVLLESSVEDVSEALGDEIAVVTNERDALKIENKHLEVLFRTEMQEAMDAVSQAVTVNPVSVDEIIYGIRNLGALASFGYTPASVIRFFVEHHPLDPGNQGKIRPDNLDS